MAIDCVQNHTAYIYDRGGQRRIAQLTKLSLVKWGRVRDDMSEAEVRIEGEAECNSQATILRDIQPWRHELVIFRDGDRVWEGPIIRVRYGVDQVSVVARDVSAWLYRTIMRDAYSSSYPTVETTVGRAGRIIKAELLRKHNAETLAGLPDLNVLPFVTEHHFPNEAETTASTLPYQYTVFEHVDSLAQRSGIDYTTVGRAIHLWDVSRPLGTTRTVTQADFLGEITVTRYGMDLATYVAITDGMGNYGDTGGVDPYYGLVERLTTAFDESSGDEPPTVAALISQAQREIAGRNPVPTVIRVPENSTLNPNGVLQMSDLVPGVHIPVRLDRGVLQLTQLQKLKSVSVVDDEGGSLVQVTLLPASDPDEDEEE